MTQLLYCITAGWSWKNKNTLSIEPETVSYFNFYFSSSFSLMLRCDQVARVLDYIAFCTGQQILNLFRSPSSEWYHIKFRYGLVSWRRGLSSASQMLCPGYSWPLTDYCSYQPSGYEVHKLLWMKLGNHFCINNTEAKIDVGCNTFIHTYFISILQSNWFIQYFLLNVVQCEGNLTEACYY